MIEFLSVPIPLSPSFPIALKRAADDPEVEGIALEFSGTGHDEEIDSFLDSDATVDSLRDTLRALEIQQKPLVAHSDRALAGLALEVFLGCHQRFTSGAGFSFQWPWIEVGLPPALGSGRRLCHIVGLEKALQLFLFNHPLSLAEIAAANETESVKGDWRPAAEAWIRNHPKPVQPWDEIDVTRSPLFSQTVPNRTVLQNAYIQWRKKTPAEDRAGGLLLQSFHDGLERSFAAALEIEKVAFRRARASASTNNRLYVHDLKRRALRKAGTPSHADHHLGVLGAGLMGTGIATSALLAGCDVVLFEIDPEAIKRSSARIEKTLSRKSTTGQDLAKRLRFTQELSDLAGCDFVIEAVFERFDVKADLLKRAAAFAPKHGVMASNTTTFPISDLAAAIPDPARFIGTHFFAPVDQMELLEIIVGHETSAETTKRALALAKMLGKIPVVVKDGPGFYTSRVVMAYIQEALFLLSEGVSPSLIDHCAQNAGMIIGPLTMADLTSLELLADIYRNLAKHGRGAATQSGAALDILARFLAAGRIGRKSGGGIYDYPSPNEKREWPALSDWFPRVQRAETEITDRLAFIQIIETLHCLKEGIIADPETADLASVLGWKYPAFLGGVMRYKDDLGEERFEVTRKALERKFGPRFALA